MIFLSFLYRILIFTVCIVFLAACNGEGTRAVKSRSHTTSADTKPKKLQLIKPGFREKTPSGQMVKIQLEWVDSIGYIDSTIIFFDSQPVSVLGTGELTADISLTNVLPGNRNLRVVAHLNSGQVESFSSQIEVLSDIIPEKYSYRVIKEFPHDIGAFTQGFEYYEGYFYEGTGQYGESSVRKTEVSTGQVLTARTLSSEFFGEGITILNNKIYQVTYRSQVGFVYNLQTFEQIRKIYYQNKEAWGLANNGKDVIMSDGTNIIYFMDPQYFTVNSKIEVMDHTGPIDAINELEWIEGKIWANRYLTDEIVIIDPESGKVEGKINLAGILKPEDRHSRVDLLNGIAWDREGRRLFVTGKYWPKIFQIEINKL